MSFHRNNNNNNNNNSKRFHNRYVVPVSLGTTAAPGTHVPGNSRQSARNVAAEAAQHEQDRQMAARINRAIRRPGSLRRAASANVASGNKYSSSSGANNGSKSGGSSPHHTSHIRRGTVTPLPAVTGQSRLGWDRYPKCPAGLSQPVRRAPHYREELRVPNSEFRVPSSESDGVHSHRPALYVPHGCLEAQSI